MHWPQGLAQRAVAVLSEASHPAPVLLLASAAGLLGALRLWETQGPGLKQNVGSVITA